LDAVDGYIEFASTTHPSFLMGRDHGSGCRAVLREDNNSVDAYFFGHLEIHSIASVGVGGGQAAAQP
jgi:hypothetical protein